jgi:cytochrome c biogenesis protein CcmG, thiol:disulfide interchange protein DsbE
MRSPWIHKMNPFKMPYGLFNKSKYRVIYIAPDLLPLPYMKWLFFLVLLVLACKPSISQPKGPTIVSYPTISKPTDTTIYPFHIALQDSSMQIHPSYAILPSNDKPTVLLFWLTTCIPCGRELTSIKENYARWKQEVDFELVAISEDWEDRFPDFVARIRQENWPFKAYWDSSQEFKQILPGRLNGLPQTFIYDKKGRLAWSKKGFVPGDEQLLFQKIREAAGS